jgi:CheY-like chemotaxis protein
MMFHVVHVESDVSSRDTLSAIFTAAQLNIYLKQFDRGEHALAYLAEHSSDIHILVLAHQLMGVLSGLEITQHMRLRGYTGIIFLRSGMVIPDQSILTVAQCEYIPLTLSSFELLQKILQHQPALPSTTLMRTPPPITDIEQPSQQTEMVIVEEKRCRICGNPLPDNLGVCLRCGAIVEPGKSETTHRVANLGETLAAPPIRGLSVVPDYAVITLVISDEHIILPQSNYVILGRVYNQPTTAQASIDLSRFHAHALGVSRQHARIDQEDNVIYITDLGSTNGTFVNEQPLLAHEKHLIHSGDIIRLARLQIQVQF